MTAYRISLSKVGALSEPVAVTGAALSAHLVLPNDGAISTAVVELQWSIDPDKKHWLDLDDLAGVGRALLSSASPSLRGVDVRGLLWLRFKTITAASSPPAQADLILHFAHEFAADRVREFAIEGTIQTDDPVEIIAPPAAGRKRLLPTLILKNNSSDSANIKLINRKGSTDYEVARWPTVAQNESVIFGESPGERILLDDTDESVRLDVDSGGPGFDTDYNGICEEGPL